jgi:tripartite-type tricarboxylate transporter receptor subunit TctC
MKASPAFLCALAVAGAALTPAAAMGQNYPVKAVTVVVPFAPGGSTDIIARAMGQELSKIWGQPVIVDNRAGGATIIGTEMVVKAAPDGYTLLNNAAPMSTNIGLYGSKLPYDIFRDLAPIIFINTTPLVFTVNAAHPAKSMKEFIALAKAKPGQMNFGSSAAGGINHFSGELFNMLAGTSVVHVPYKGNAPALTDLLGGRLDFVFNGTTSVLNLLQSGKLRALAVSSPRRVSSLPEVPTLDEVGLKGFQAYGWNAMMAPAKTPAAIIARINADANKALNAPDMQQRLKNDGSETMGGTPEALLAFLKEDSAKWAKVAKAANIKVE